MNLYETFVKIDVTAKDIAEGVRRDCKKCPVALAVHRKVHPHLIVTVTLEGVRINESLKNPPRWNGEDFSMSEFGPGVGKFILDYDARIICHPFSFEIELPEKFLRELPTPVV